MRSLFSSVVLAVIAATLSSLTTYSQTTEFTYQGSLKNAGTTANGNFDFEFALFDAVSGGTQIGSTIVLNGVSVTEGVFSVKLDFGDQFSGAGRFLEIRVRPSGQPGITILAPRQPINSAPYSVKSLKAANADNSTNAVNATNATTAGNALQLGGVTADQFVQTGDPRLSDARDPLPGSISYIQNNTSQQSSSNFNISGTGTANVFSATTQFNLGANRVLGIPGTDNTFVGIGAGQNITTGIFNSFFGKVAGQNNTTGFQNAFFGTFAGSANTEGGDNSFFGSRAGNSNTTGSQNSFFGSQAGLFNTTGSGNAFFGRNSGFLNTTGFSNSFFGSQSGQNTTTGASNSFFGASAGLSNTTGSSNAFFRLGCRSNKHDR